MPGENTDGIPPYQKRIALVALLLNVGLIVLFHSRLSADFWPPDSARIAPNIVASIVQAEVVLIVAALLWPPTRKKIHAFVDGKADSIKAHVTAHHAHASAEFDALHEKLDHVIANHPDISELPDGVGERPDPI